MANESLDNYGEEENNEMETLDFDEVETKMNKEFDDGPSKPEFSKNTNAQVKGMEVQRSTNPKKDKKGNEYYEISLMVKVQIEGQTDDDGNPLESVDRYGGLREYDKYFWNGKKSAYGKLRKKMEDEFDIKTHKELFAKLPQQKVKILTETVKYDGEEFKKNVIQSFR